MEPTGDSNPGPAQVLLASPLQGRSTVELLSALSLCPCPGALARRPYKGLIERDSPLAWRRSTRPTCW